MATMDNTTAGDHLALRTPAIAPASLVYLSPASRRAEGATTAARQQFGVLRSRCRPAHHRQLLLHCRCTVHPVHKKKPCNSRAISKELHGEHKLHQSTHCFYHQALRLQSSPQSFSACSCPLALKSGSWRLPGIKSRLLHPDTQHALTLHLRPGLAMQTTDCGFHSYQLQSGTHL